MEALLIHCAGEQVVVKSSDFVIGEMTEPVPRSGAHQLQLAVA